MSSVAVKDEILRRVSSGQRWFPVGMAKFKVGNRLIHVRYCSADKSNSVRYKFNINPNSLVSDYELWICGDVDHYYLIPNPLIRDIYADPSAYPDKRHSEIRVVSVNAGSHIATYATGGKFVDLSTFLCAKVKL
jgi:hypothetical protein